MEHLHDFFLHIVDGAGFVGLLIVMILGNLAVPVGVEIILPVSGMLAATGHLPSVWGTILVALLGELIGGSLLYAIGRYGGPPFVHKFGRFVHLREPELAKVHRFYERFGAKTVFISRFLPVIRGIAALPAGLSEMRWRWFLIYTFAGSGIFCAALVSLGARLGTGLYRSGLMPLLGKLALLIPVIVIVAIVVLVLRRRREAAR